MRFLVLLLLPLIAAVEVDVGWSGATQTGAWTPVFVTADGDGSATIELYVPGEGPWGQRIRRDVVLTAEPQTFPLYARIDGPAADVSVRLFGADGRTIAWAQPQVTREIVAPARLIGVGGTVPNELAALDEPFGMTAVGAVPMLRLPREAVGYDGLDLLVLADLDPADLPVAIANAIAEWVQSGGRLAVTFAPAPRLGDGKLDQMLREPGAHGLGEVSIGEQDWAALIESRTLPQVESVAPRPVASRLWVVVGIGLIGLALADAIVLRLCHRKPTNTIVLLMLAGGLVAVFLAIGPKHSTVARNRLMVQTDDAVVRQVGSSQHDGVGGVGWSSARADGADAELVQLADGNHLRFGPVALDRLDLTPADPVLLLVGDRLAAVGSVSVHIGTIHHRGKRLAGSFTLEGGKVVDLTTLDDLGPTDTPGTLIEGEVNGHQLRAVW